MKKLLVLSSFLVSNIYSQTLSLSTNPPPSVTTLNASIVGVPGGNIYYYWVVANYPIGSVPSNKYASVSNANGTLTSGNYVNISYNSIGATNYTIVRTTTPSFSGTCSNCVVLANTTSNPVADNGETLTSLSLTPASPVNATLYIDNKNENIPTLRTSMNYPGNITSGLIPWGVQNGPSNPLTPCLMGTIFYNTTTPGFVGCTSSGTWASLGSGGGGGTPAGPTNAVQTNAGGGNFGDSGCTAVSGVITCDTFTSTNPFSAIGLPQSGASLTVPSGQFGIFYNSDNSNHFSVKNGTTSAVTDLQAGGGSSYGVLASLLVTTVETTTSTTPVDLATPDSVTFSCSSTCNFIVQYIATNIVPSTTLLSSYNTVYVDGTQVDSGLQEFTTNNTSGFAYNAQSLAGWKVISAASGSHTVDIKHYVNTNTGTWLMRQLVVTQVP